MPKNSPPDAYAVIVTYPDGEGNELIGPFATTAEAAAWIVLAQTSDAPDFGFTPDDKFDIHLLMPPIVPAGNNAKQTK